MVRRRGLRGLVRTAALLGVLVVGSACGSATTAPAKAPVPPPVSADALSKVVLKVGDQKGGSRSQLAAAGLLDDVPYRIEWSTFTSGPPLLEAVSAGAVDVGSVGNTPPLFAAAANARLSLVSASKADPAGDAILVPPDSPLRAVTELRGKTIGVAKGSSAHGQILYTLARAGLGLGDVRLSFLQPSEAYSAFTQKQIDAWAVWDPYTAQAEIEAGARVLATGEGTANGYGFQAASIGALGDAGKNAAIADFVTRLARAQVHNDAHPEDRARTWTAETGLPIDVTRRAADRKNQLPVPMDQALVDSEQRLADALADARVLPGRIRFEDFVDRRFDAQVVAVR
ncbi:ABC transporter substrate-binding protein [Saccharopolyspora erythraea]|uniref:ABC transporter substrate-binding protein n=1 Tax=Saccharopolyspora erythraea TaxID=1836 RepID=UPI001BAB8ADA|nr:ABC transporter substrate-binding protein [Saccharopolyspora erythraea]QUH02628.1 ABC transporter substrate-binding protein [Saccharopolyspora erythraea]